MAWHVASHRRDAPVLWTWRGDGVEADASPSVRFRRDEHVHSQHAVDATRRRREQHEEKKGRRESTTPDTRTSQSGPRRRPCAGTCGRGRSARPLTQQDRALKRATPRAVVNRPRPAARTRASARSRSRRRSSAPRRRPRRRGVSQRQTRCASRLIARATRRPRRARPRRRRVVLRGTQQQLSGRCAPRSGARSGRASSARRGAAAGLLEMKRPSPGPRRGALPKPGGRGRRPSAARSSRRRRRRAGFDRSRRRGPRGRRFWPLSASRRWRLLMMMPRRLLTSRRRRLRMPRLMMPSHSLLSGAVWLVVSSQSIDTDAMRERSIRRGARMARTLAESTIWHAIAAVKSMLQELGIAV